MTQTISTACDGESNIKAPKKHRDDDDDDGQSTETSVWLMLCEVLRGRSSTFKSGRIFCALTRQKQKLCEVCGNIWNKSNAAFQKRHIRGEDQRIPLLDVWGFLESRMGANWTLNCSSSASVLGAVCSCPL